MELSRELQKAKIETRFSRAKIRMAPSTMLLMQDYQSQAKIVSRGGEMPGTPHLHRLVFGRNDRDDEGDVTSSD